jgi:hypothetical protein
VVGITVTASPNVATHGRARRRVQGGRGRAK